MFASAIIPIAIDEEETDVREGDLARHAEEALLSKRPPVVLEALDRKHYDDGHIPTARLLPLAEIDRAPAIVADKDQAIVLYCASRLAGTRTRPPPISNVKATAMWRSTPAARRIGSGRGCDLRNNLRAENAAPLDWRVPRAGGDYSRSVFFVVSAPAQQTLRGNRPRPDKIFFAS